MEQIRVGVIGIGNMGSKHAKCIADGEIPGMLLTAVADRREERKTWAKENLPESVSFFSEGSELIHSGLCDAVVVATPHYQHPPLVCEALKAGLHALSEKPAGVYTKQVREMNETAKASGKVFGMMFNVRTNCIYRKMHEIVTSGEMGKIKRVNWIVTDWYRSQAYYDSGDWRATWDGEGGGVLLNQCPHNLDLLQWICGMPSRVRAFCHYGKWHHIEVEDDVTAYLEFPNGATGVFVTSTADLPGTNRFEIMMERGKLVCEDGKVKRWLLPESERELCFQTEETFPKVEIDCEEVETDGEYSEQPGVLRAFAAHILHGTPMIAEGYEGINSLMLSNAMHLSDWLNQTVELPLDEDLFLAELNKRRHTCGCQ